MKRFFTLIICIIILPIQAKAQTLEQDSLALVALYDSTDGANWSNPWDLNTPISTWNGVTVSGERVITVSLPFRQLGRFNSYRTGEPDQSQRTLSLFQPADWFHSGRIGEPDQSQRTLSETQPADRFHSGRTGKLD